MQPLLVTIEGVPCSGKTTLQSNFTSHYSATPMLSVMDIAGGPEKFAHEPTTYHEIRQREHYFLNLHLRRMAEGMRLKEEGKIAVIDHSYASWLSFSYAYEKRSHVPTFRDACMDLLSAMESGLVAHPDIHLYLDIPYTVAMQRYRERGRFVNRVFQEEEFFVDYKEFYESFLRDAARKSFFLDGTQPKEHVLAQAARVMDGMAEAPERDPVFALRKFLRKH